MYGLDKIVSNILECISKSKVFEVFVYYKNINHFAKRNGTLFHYTCTELFIFCHIYCIISALDALDNI